MKRALLHGFLAAAAIFAFSSCVYYEGYYDPYYSDTGYYDSGGYYGGNFYYYDTYPTWWTTTYFSYPRYYDTHRRCYYYHDTRKNCRYYIKNDSGRFNHGGRYITRGNDHYTEDRDFRRYDGYNTRNRDRYDDTTRVYTKRPLSPWHQGDSVRVRTSDLDPGTTRTLRTRDRSLNLDDSTSRSYRGRSRSLNLNDSSYSEGERVRIAPRSSRAMNFSPDSPRAFRSSSSDGGGTFRGSRSSGGNSGGMSESRSFSSPAPSFSPPPAPPSSPPPSPPPSSSSGGGGSSDRGGSSSSNDSDGGGGGGRRGPFGR